MRRAVQSLSEDDLQISVAGFLSVAMPKGIAWTAVESSNRGAIQGAKMKAKGVRAGFMDLQFILAPFGTYLGIELKAKGGSPSKSQKAMGGLISDSGGFWFPAKSLGDVEYILRAFGVQLKSRSMELPRPHLVKLVDAAVESLGDIIAVIKKEMEFIA